MARRARQGSRTDTTNLELHRGYWRVTVAVPKAAQPVIRKTRLKQPLGTDSLALANKLKGDYVDAFRKRIKTALEGTKGDPLTREALRLAALTATVSDDDTHEALLDAVRDRADEIRGDPIDEVETRSGHEYVYDAKRERQASDFYFLASGALTPITAHRETYRTQHARLKSRTIADDDRAIVYLERWCAENGLPSTVETITESRATLFMDALPKLAGGITPTTVKKYRNRLSVYWQWLKARGFATANIWAEVKVTEPQRMDSELARGFTEHEMQNLLSGSAPQKIHDLMRIAALSGARLDAIVCLTVGDCKDSSFRFKPQKKETSSRIIPIHSGLKEIVDRRTEGKGEGDPVFPEWPAPQRAGSTRERSFKASNQFTAYRRTVGVDDRVEGSRRARTTFHSFRHWFVEQAEHAGQHPHIFQRVLGHKRPGVTLSVYGRGGPSEEQLRACVEAVRLPE
jgi:hypothetical protein